MNRDLLASSLYHHPDFKFNCAQAIAYRWAFSFDEAQIRALEFQKFGGGNAPEGMCGALYAGLERLSGNSGAQLQLKSLFQDRASSPSCVEIKNANQLTCKACVELVDDFLAQTLA